MSGNTIQRQSILSTIIIFAGFAFGAFNLLVLQKWALTTEQWGLTRVITESAILLASFATFGSTAIVAKFLPFYQRYQNGKTNDLPFITLLLAFIGIIVTTILVLLLKPYILIVFGKNNPFFTKYYYVLPVFVVTQFVFISLEIHAVYAGKIVWVNGLKELLFRLLMSAILMCIGLKLLDFDQFMFFFAFIYLLPSAGLVYILVKDKKLPIVPKLSILTKRLTSKFITLGAFVFASSVSQIAFTVCSTLFLAGKSGLKYAGVWAVADYFSTVLEVPMRSLQSSSIPLIAEYWRAKNYVGLLSLYKKSCTNLIIVGFSLGGVIILNAQNLTTYFGPDYQMMTLPLIILITSKWINLGTGLNSMIIQLSSKWRFDFLSNMIYSIIGIPLNFVLIHYYDMMGAAMASFIAMFFFNFVRSFFIWKKFNLFPYDIKFLKLFLISVSLIFAMSKIPYTVHFVLDAFLRTSAFILIYTFIILKGDFSLEISELWSKWKKKIPLIRNV